MLDKKLALTQSEVMALLGIGYKKFKSMNLPFVILGKRKKFLISDVEEFLERNKQGGFKCQSSKEAIPSTIGIRSQLMEKGFEEQRKLLIEKKQSRSKL